MIVEEGCILDGIPRDDDDYARPLVARRRETMKVLPLDHEQRLLQGRAYYERLARGRNTDWVLRYVHAKYGNDASGTAVFRESFNREFHIKDGHMPVSS